MTNTANHRLGPWANRATALYAQDGSLLGLMCSPTDAARAARCVSAMDGRDPDAVVRVLYAAHAVAGSSDKPVDLSRALVQLREALDEVEESR
jgi:hypothetical protein